ncbi:7-cyano-7-deazaguanine synthase QueC [bacterium]|nr:7-cyano-7-deazaguanine synthase QueC [bacterium]
MSKAVVLLSGGLDSVVSLALIKEYCTDILALTFNYKQKSFEKEAAAAKKIAEFYNAEHIIIDISWLGRFSMSALTSSKDIPDINSNDLDNKEIAEQTAKSVWIPNRNGLFVNIAACYAEALKYDLIVIGANKEESATFKDNSINFINSINNALSNSTDFNVKVISPIINKTKKEIVADGIRLNIPFNLVYSCYNSGELHCGHCESCKRFIRALKENNRQDIIDKIFNKG